MNLCHLAKFIYVYIFNLSRFLVSILLKSTTKILNLFKLLEKKCTQNIK